MFHLDTLSTLVAATLVLLLGRKLVQTVPFLKKYTIPEPVAGGLLVALALLALKKSMDIEIDFDMSLKDPLMLAFFATIGLNANLASLRAGGKVLGTFLIVVVGLLLLQNALGIGMATLLGLDPLMGLLAGSITLSGGHGTGAAWSKLFVERYGFANATEGAMACATFGRVLGGLIGGPVARYLVKHSSSPDGTPDDQVAPTAFEKPDVGRVITSLVLIESIALIAICLTVGKVVAQLLAGSVFELPTFVCVLFIGVILSNSLALAGLYRVFDRAVSVLGNVSLSLFLAMALMSLKLWELASLALPMIIILAVQALAMALYAVFVTYRMMGKNYDAAVLAAGPTLYWVAKTMLRSGHDCADAAQQAILRAWEQLDSLRSTRYFKTWLVRILINECSTILRRQQRLAPYDAAAAEAIPAPAADDYSDLYAAITVLEEKLRLPVELYYLEGFKTREIAGMLGIPENTVKTRLRAAREHLRKDLKGACFA